MNDPNSPQNFLSFSDYLGLNTPAAGGGMGNELFRQNAHFLDDANTGEARLAAEAQDRGNRGLSEDTKGEADVGNNLASYGAFLKNMSDPATRQSLMEKAFGPVSSRDSAVAGAQTSGQLRGATAQYKSSQSAVDNNDVHGLYQGAYDAKTAFDKGQAADDARRAANKQAWDTMKAGNDERRAKQAYWGNGANFKSSTQYEGGKAIDPYGEGGVGYRQSGSPFGEQTFTPMSAAEAKDYKPEWWMSSGPQGESAMDAYNKAYRGGWGGQS